MTDFPDNDPVWQKFAKNALQEILPKLVDSAVSVSLVPRPGEHEVGDVKYWTELGVTIMLDKPIILLVPPDRTEIPEKLRQIADEIIVADPRTRKGQKEISERIALFVERFK